jgi:hypothetical protein
MKRVVRRATPRPVWSGIGQRLEAEERRSDGRYIVKDVNAGSGQEYPPAIHLDRSFLLQIEGERLAEIGLELLGPPRVAVAETAFQGAVVSELVDPLSLVPLGVG